MSLDKKLRCMFKEWAESQRATELARGLDYEGTRGYETTGCYDCSGYDFDCPKHKNLKDFRNKC
jgi:hypothetical protein